MDAYIGLNREFQGKKEDDAWLLDNVAIENTLVCWDEILRTIQNCSTRTWDYLLRL